MVADYPAPCRNQAQNLAQQDAKRSGPGFDAGAVAAGELPRVSIPALPVDDLRFLRSAGRTAISMIRNAIFDDRRQRCELFRSRVEIVESVSEELFCGRETYRDSFPRRDKRSRANLNQGAKVSGWR
jgi:hypothetical protein